MLLSGSVTVENNAAAVLVGYADEAVRGMARIRLLDGRLPEAPGEIALERAAAFRLNAELGGTVTAAVTLADGRSETRTWKVTGLLQNYAAVWESYYRYAAGHFPEDVTIQPLNGLLCEQEAAALCALPYLYLLDAPRPDGLISRPISPTMSFTSATIPFTGSCQAAAWAFPVRRKRFCMWASSPAPCCSPWPPSSSALSC